MRNHVITPLARYQNYGKLADLLRPQGVQWHVITDAGSTKVTPEEEWIHSYNMENSGTPFWARCNQAINWFLDRHSLYMGDRYGILNDDDAYEEDFFKKLSEFPSEVIAVSMKRGNSTPKDVTPERAHGTNTLVAAPENMKVGHVGVEQLLVSGRILSQCRLPIHICGDGQWIEYVVATQPVIYVPDAFVLFNYLEPGRWE